MAVMPLVLDAVREQLDKGYEIGPQHPVAGEVADLVCELTGHERAALCAELNTDPPRGVNRAVVVDERNPAVVGFDALRHPAVQNDDDTAGGVV